MVWYQFSFYEGRVTWRGCVVLAPLFPPPVLLILGAVSGSGSAASGVPLFPLSGEVLPVCLAGNRLQ